MEKDLKEIKKIFNKLKVEFFLLCGTLLGAYRDKDFIKEDRDIDIGTFDKDKREIITQELIKAGFKLRIGHPKNAIGLHLTLDRNTITDIHFLRKKNDKCYCQYRPGKGCLSFPMKLVKELSKIKFKGMSFLTPTPITEYLEGAYGDWKNKENKNQTRSSF